jgi:hypothetical protein
MISYGKGKVVCLDIGDSKSNRIGLYCQTTRTRSLKKSLFAAQNIFSMILRVASLQIQNSPFRLKHWICGRFASLRMVTEKILIRVQSSFFIFSEISGLSQESIVKEGNREEEAEP